MSSLLREKEHPTELSCFSLFARPEEPCGLHGQTQNCTENNRMIVIAGWFGIDGHDWSVLSMFSANQCGYTFLSEDIFIFLRPRHPCICSTSEDISRSRSELQPVGTQPADRIAEQECHDHLPK